MKWRRPQSWSKGGRVAATAPLLQHSNTPTLHFLLRSDYDTVRRQGVLIRSLEGDFQVQPQCVRRPEEIGPADLVLIGLKTTANEAFAKLLPPLVGSGTAV